MKNTCAKRRYECKCGTINECYVWQSDLAKHNLKCKKCNKLLIYDDLLKEVKTQLPSIRTDTKNR
jgi:phage FluMu protein Com